MNSRVLALALSCLLAPASMAAAHGSLSVPLSRVYNGFLEGPESPQSAAVQAAIAVGGTQPFYDWNEVVNFYPGTPAQQVNAPYQEFIPDGKLASGGNFKYRGLDLVRDDWPATSIEVGPFEFVWYASTPHDPSVFHAWITVPGWTPDQPLTWAAMEPLQLGPVMLVGNEYRFNTILPSRTGKHCIYVIWQRLDPVGEGFYCISDVDFGAGSGPQCPADLDGDGSVSGSDLGALLAAWGSPAADLDGDGTTAGSDLGALLAAWGACGPDCDDDGISDAAEIAAGASDCDVNGIPDECEALADCDGDGVIDVCAILQGAVDDCDMNLVPDSCDFAAGGDADGDGQLDACQLNGLTYAWSVPDQWGSGFVASLTITNNGDQMVHGWQLQFAAPGYTIVNAWNSVFVSHAGGVATLANEMWNDHLHPGDSVTIGYQAAGVPSAPAWVKLNGSVVHPE